MRKPDFCICENKGADQLRGNREADQRLCFRYSDSVIPLLQNPKFQVCSHSPVCVRPSQKPRRPVFSERGSYLRDNLAAKAILINANNKGLYGKFTRFFF